MDHIHALSVGAPVAEVFIAFMTYCCSFRRSVRDGGVDSPVWNHNCFSTGQHGCCRRHVKLSVKTSVSKAGRFGRAAAAAVATVTAEAAAAAVVVCCSSCLTSLHRPCCSTICRGPGSGYDCCRCFIIHTCSHGVSPAHDDCAWLLCSCFILHVRTTVMHS